MGLHEKKGTRVADNDANSKTANITHSQFFIKSHVFYMFWMSLQEITKYSHASPLVCRVNHSLKC